MSERVPPVGGPGCGPEGGPGCGPEGGEANHPRAPALNSPTMVNTPASWCRTPTGKATKPATTAAPALTVSNQRAQSFRRQVNHARTQAPSAQPRNIRHPIHSAGTSTLLSRLARCHSGVPTISLTMRSWATTRTTMVPAYSRATRPEKTHVRMQATLTVTGTALPAVA